MRFWLFRLVLRHEKQNPSPLMVFCDSILVSNECVLSLPLSIIYTNVNVVIRIEKKVW